MLGNGPKVYDLSKCKSSIRSIARQNLNGTWGKNAQAIVDHLNGTNSPDSFDALREYVTTTASKLVVRTKALFGFSGNSTFKAALEGYLYKIPTSAEFNRYQAQLEKARKAKEHAPKEEQTEEKQEERVVATELAQEEKINALQQQLLETALISEKGDPVDSDGEKFLPLLLSVDWDKARDVTTPELQRRSVPKAISMKEESSEEEEETSEEFKRRQTQDTVAGLRKIFGPSVI